MKRSLSSSPNLANLHDYTILIAGSFIDTIIGSVVSGVTVLIIIPVMVIVVAVWYYKRFVVTVAVKYSLVVILFCLSHCLNW